MRQFIVLAVALSSVGCAPSIYERIAAIPAWNAEYNNSNGDSMAQPLAEMEARITAWGITIVRERVKGTAGTSSFFDRLITLDPELPVDAQFEVLAHEAAHIIQPPAMKESDRAVREVWAEMVALGVFKFYGHKRGPEVVAKYLAAHKDGLEAMRYMEKDIQIAVKMITGQVHTILKF